MARSRKNPVQDTDWKHVLAAATIVVLVFGTLLLGAMLQADADDPLLAGSSMLRGGEPPDAGDGRAVVGDTETARALAVPIVGDGVLIDRVADDERRLQASGNGYTKQFAVLCQAENALAKLEALKRHQDFYLLTMLYQDRACFRLCWGFYDTEQQARADRKIPSPLLSITREPKVITIAEALP